MYSSCGIDSIDNCDNSDIGQLDGNNTLTLSDTGVGTSQVKNDKFSTYLLWPPTMFGVCSQR